ncbi:MAG: site-2 protease family protein [Candidatus Woesearchaeota archaeon]|nr:site-2 protease family protein [Candidatus Woesearchaeota archaeon]
MNVADIVSISVFVLLMAFFLYKKRDKISIEKIVYPALYMIMYRTSFGLKFMNSVAKKRRNLVQFLGYTFIGLAFLGMVYISVAIIVVIIMFLIKPAAVDTGFVLVLPGTSIPGIGYLSFWYWIISIFILAIVHEFAHGIVARAHDLDLKSSGFAFLAIFLPVIPAAFVEPDEKKLVKRKDIVQYSVFAAGPMANIILAFIIFLLMPYVWNPSAYAPFEIKITEPVGFSFSVPNATAPSAIAGIQSGMIFNSIDNVNGTESLLFLRTMLSLKPNQTVVLGSVEGKTYSVLTIEHPDLKGAGYFGVNLNSIKNERMIKNEYKSISPAYYWFKGLFKWLFILNFLIGLANLLPLGIVDGGRMLQVALHNIMKDKKKANKVWGFITILFVLLLVVGLAGHYLKVWGLF